MPTDMRKLPPQVMERLSAAGVDLGQRMAGFDVDRGPRILEQRVISQQQASLQVEERAEAGQTVRGYASIWGYEYDMYGGPEAYGWTESVEAGSATKSLSENDNVRLLFDHEGLPLATTRAGTLRVEDDKFGLYTEADPDEKSAYSQEIVSRLGRGELDSMSFAFSVIRQEWNADYTRRWIREVRLFDVSVVNYPANPATVVGLARSAPASDHVNGRALDEARDELLRYSRPRMISA